MAQQPAHRSTLPPAKDWLLWPRVHAPCQTLTHPNQTAQRLAPALPAVSCWSFSSNRAHDMSTKCVDMCGWHLGRLYQLLQQGSRAQGDCRPPPGGLTSLPAGQTHTKTCSCRSRRTFVTGRHSHRPLLRTRNRQPGFTHACSPPAPQASRRCMRLRSLPVATSSVQAGTHTSC